MHRTTHTIVLTAGLLVFSACGGGQVTAPDPEEVFASEHHDFRVEIVTEGLEHPWAVVFLPDGDALVTERPGRMQRVDLETGERTPIDGVPEVAAVGQGGLLDVALHPAFAENRWVYLTYAAGPDDGGGGHATHLGRGRLQEDRLADFEVLYAATPFVGGGRHFGSRIVFDDDGHVYFTIGDRGERQEAQNLQNDIGTTIRLSADGEVPEDNPFIGDATGRDAIYSFGHRNVQGMAVHPESRRIWQHEHGPRGGDEVNLLQAGANYGWPLASYGVEYATGRAIGPDPHDHEGTVSPIHHWEDSFAPSGMAFYDAELFAEWRGDLFVGGLAVEYLARLDLDGEEVVSEEPLLEGLGWRIRDVRLGPEGALYLLVDAADAPLARLVPADD